MNQLAIFDIDGTLTDTTGVDDECYRDAAADALGILPSAIDWSSAAHVTDSEIFRWLCTMHGQEERSVDAAVKARADFVERLTLELASQPARFTAIRGAAHALVSLEGRGWSVAIATGGWGPSARLKLNAAGIRLNDAVFACADDATTRVDIVRLARSRAEAFYGRTFDRVVSIGDGTWDVETAATLALPFVGIGVGRRETLLRNAGAGVVVADYTDLNYFCEVLATAPVPPCP